MKLGNIFKGNSIVIAQSPHGKAQNYKAMDLYGTSPDRYSIIAPAAGRILRVYSAGKQSLFDFGDKDWFIQFVHCVPTISKNTIVEKGALIGVMVKVPPIHTHIAINVKGSWGILLSYMDQGIKLLSENGKPPTVWQNWNTYPDKKLFINNSPMVKAVQLPDLYKLTSTNTTTFNIRLEPFKNALDIGDVPSGYTWEGNIYAVGENIQGNTSWWQVIVPAGQPNAGVVGYCAGKFVKAEKIANDPTLEIKLKDYETRLKAIKPLASDIVTRAKIYILVNKKMSDSFKEAGKELLRVVLLSIVPVILVGLENGQLDVKVVFVIGAIAALRFIDKWLHENAPNGKAGGLTRF